LQSTFISLTTNIEERTTTAEHPGIITQVTNAVNTGIGKVEGFIDQVS
jgi:hypothetical protein